MIIVACCSVDEGVVCGVADDGDVVLHSTVDDYVPRLMMVTSCRTVDDNDVMSFCWCW